MSADPLAFTHRIQHIHWGHALDWNAPLTHWLESYRARLILSYTPNPGRRDPFGVWLEPLVLETLPLPEQAQIQHLAHEIRTLARARGERIEHTTQRLIALILSWAAALDFDPSTSPATPLLELFEAGYQLQISHHGIEIHASVGWQIYPLLLLPTSLSRV